MEADPSSSTPRAIATWTSPCSGSSAPTQVYDVADGRVARLEVTPEDFGLTRAPVGAVRGGTVEANLQLARAVLHGEPGPARDVVLLNAAAGLVVGGLVRELAEGVDLARETINSGAARTKLEQIRSVSATLRSRAETP